MNTYVQVMCFWGGEVLTDNENGFRYSTCPKKVVIIQRNTLYDELIHKLYNELGKDPSQWNFKLSCKYPSYIVNGVSKFYRLEINNDNDVDIMLGIPERCYNNNCGVELYIELEQVTSSLMGSDNFLMGYFGNTNLLSQLSPSNLEQPEIMNRSYGGTSQIYQNQEFGVGGSGHGGMSMYEEPNYDHYYNRSGEHAVHGAYSPTDVVEVEDEEDTRWGPDPNLVSSTIFNIASREDFPDSYGASTILPTDDEGSDEDDPVTNQDNEDNAYAGNVGNVNVFTREHQPMASWYKTEEFKNEITDHGYRGETFDSSCDELYLGALFANKDVLKSVVEGVHIKERRNFDTYKSNETTYEVKCKSEKCPWRLRASKLKKHGYFQITKLSCEHICHFANPSQDHAKLTAKFIGNTIKSMIAENPKTKVVDIQSMINQTYEYHVTYKKAWYGKQAAIAAIYGNWETSYAQLPRFMSAIKTYNPGSVVKIEVDPYVLGQGKSIFKRMWWAFKPVIDGWLHARPVLTIDGTFLKGKYKGKLLVAMGFDSRMRQYPVAYGLVDEETVDNWSWFLKLLRQYVCKQRWKVCLISDRAQGIIQAMKAQENGFTAPAGVHRFCLRHVQSNFASANPGSQLKFLCWKAGSTHQVRKFEAYMKEIRKLSREAYDWLRNIPTEMWTLSHDGGCRYGVTSTNLVECFNNNIMSARNLPITAMVEYIFYRSVQLFSVKRMESLKEISDGHEFCIESRKKFERIMQKATAHMVHSYNVLTGIFDVKTARVRRGNNWKGGNIQVVRLNEWTCSCEKWKAERYPCSHVVAACMKIKKDWRSYIADHHTNVKYAKMWEPNFQPLMHQDYWTFPLPNNWETFGILIPNANLKRTKKRHADRGGPTRIHTEMDMSNRTVHCSVCGQEGHTKRSRHCSKVPQPN